MDSQHNPVIIGNYYKMPPLQGSPLHKYIGRDNNNMFVFKYTNPAGRKITIKRFEDDVSNSVPVNKYDSPDETDDEFEIDGGKRKSMRKSRRKTIRKYRRKTRRNTKKKSKRKSRRNNN